MKTILLMALLMGLLLFIGDAIGGQSGLIMAFMFSLLLNLGAYWFSDKIVLAMYRAHEVTEAEAPRLVGIVRRLAAQAQLPMPKVYIIPSETPNAFATGRNPQNAAVAATEGILRILNDEELEGVMAHELAHVKHRDILISTIVATIAGTITFLARMLSYAAIFGGRDRENSNPIGELALIILAPIAAFLIQMAISRSREFSADEGGARICQRPLALASALRKLHRSVERAPMEEANPTTAHMFIVNPFSAGGLVKLFSTHPPVEERIEKLERLAMGGI